MYSMQKYYQYMLNEWKRKMKYLEEEASKHPQSL